MCLQLDRIGADIRKGVDIGVRRSQGTIMVLGNFANDDRLCWICELLDEFQIPHLLVSVTGVLAANQRILEENARPARTKENSLRSSFKCQLQGVIIAGTARVLDHDPEGIIRRHKFLPAAKSRAPAII